MALYIKKHTKNKKSIKIHANLMGTDDARFLKDVFPDLVTKL